MAVKRHDVVVVFVVVAAMICSLFSLGAGQAVQCTNVDTANARGTCNGAVYDLSQMLDKTSGTQLLTFQAPEYMYYLKLPSGGVPTAISGCTYGPGSAIAQNGGSGQYCFVLGLVSTQIWSLAPAIGPNPQTLKIDLTGGDGGRKSSIYIKCNPSTRGNFYGTSEPQMMDYEIDVESCAVCPGANPCGAPVPPPPPPPGPPGPPGSSSSSSTTIDVGWILIIVLICTLFVYFVGFMVYNKFRLAREGREIVPNVEFWTSLPGYVKDGALFVFNKSRGKEYQPI